MVIIFYALSPQGRVHLDRWNGIVVLVIRSNVHVSNFTRPLQSLINNASDSLAPFSHLYWHCYWLWNTRIVSTT